MPNDVEVVQAGIERFLPGRMYIVNEEKVKSYSGGREAIIKIDVEAFPPDLPSWHTYSSDRGPLVALYDVLTRTILDETHKQSLEMLLLDWYYPQIRLRRVLSSKGGIVWAAPNRGLYGNLHDYATTNELDTLYTLYCDIGPGTPDLGSRIPEASRPFVDDFEERARELADELGD